ncbi:MAG: hypothetical protein HKM93_21195 [Desulfobacteraceae bacterium]|nr:hypothetical protein [Desulfobacteraceae bacterium]
MKWFQKRNGINAIGFISFAMLFSFFLMPAFVLADEDTDLDDETPAFSSPAQAQRAENLANRTSLEPDPETAAAIQGAEEKRGALALARQELERLLADPSTSPAEVNAAKSAVDLARQSYDQAQATADQKLADFVGESRADIEQMRAHGMGWGEIAHELGVHPGSLGLGHTKGKLNRNKIAEMPLDGEMDETAELKAATSRNLKTGWAKGDFEDEKTAPGKSGGKRGDTDKTPENKDKDKDKDKKDK